MKVCVTGGAGYIGSHIVAELYAQGHEAVIIDNFANSKKSVVDRIGRIVGHDVAWYEGDVASVDFLRQVFSEHAFDAVVHCAGLKAVGESVAEPLRYYRTNIDSTLTLCEVMQEYGVFNLIFSSSATVFGDPKELPVSEDSPVGLGITNPYGWTKYMIEQILRDMTVADSRWTVTILRYFNPIGAHASGFIGEAPGGIPNNLMPYVAKVAAGELTELSVYGDDYDTRDGTCIRDYIHVVDLAKGHIAALMKTGKGERVYNLGTGDGVTVHEAIRAFSRASGKEIPYTIVARRPGDVTSTYADASRAATELNWKAEKTFEEACADMWRWQEWQAEHLTGV